MEEEHKHIILFDGSCDFCNFWVHYILKRDKRDMFRFAAIESDRGKNYRRKFNIDTQLDAVILIEKGCYYTKSTAAIRILASLGGIRKVAYMLVLIPKFIRDFVYDWIAKYRNKFRLKTSCDLPLEESYKEKFL